ncbi:type IV pilus biogenesis/stability protein PilW [Aliamphritea spongicola]|uniref:type IV pilus biogenesis/stability protein PilW n=1 Tax=Aliamphritea spongicola TaxID=707589 RepID=UPI00196A22FF|nr:type IV pilus biogenesis/stability protein PilW [Aliamphritea spongicola]MBN3563985.1 type IV pilus biogenesis/stability protein PilW [Aliamphritea spongicola]
MKSCLVVLLSVLLAACAGNTTQTNGNIDNGAAEAYTQLGIQYLRDGDNANAKQAFHRATQIDPDTELAYNGLAMVFQLESENNLAEEYFKRAVSIAPDNAVLRNNYGAFLFSQERYEEACKELAVATQDPFYAQRAQAFENLGRCYQNLKRFPAAEHAFKRSLNLNPNRPVALIELADTLLAENQPDEAIIYFDRFGELVDNRQVEHYARSLWLGIRISRVKNNSISAATYGLILKNLFPDSQEYREYKESSR